MAEDFYISANATEINGAPDTVKLLSLGAVQSQRGNFFVDDESFRQINSAFKNHGIDIVIDYEHQTIKDVQAPAGGWIKELLLQDGAIAAKVEWTPKAAEYLRNKEYRYLSPVVIVRKSDQKAVALHSVALTNTPAIDGMFAIVNSMDINQGGSEMDLLKELAALLGLAEDAPGEDILKAVAEKIQNAQATETVPNKVICDLLGLDASQTKTEDMASAIMALKNPANFVPATDFNALKNRLDVRDRDDLVLKALKTGKITPAQKEWAEEYALKDPAGFEKFVAKAPQAVPYAALYSDDDKRPQRTADDETTVAVCKALGVNKEDVEKYGKDVE